MVKALLGFQSSVVMFITLLFPLQVLAGQAELPSLMHWNDLNIAQQIQMITGMLIIIAIGTVAVVIFRNVWIRKGYEGLDSVLEGKEVAMMLSHIISFICLIIFVYMITFNPYMIDKFPDYAFWICASGFVGPEVYLLVNFVRSLREKKILD